MSSNAYYVDPEGFLYQKEKSGGRAKRVYVRENDPLPEQIVLRDYVTEGRPAKSSKKSERHAGRGGGGRGGFGGGGGRGGFGGGGGRGGFGGGGGRGGFGGGGGRGGFGGGGGRGGFGGGGRGFGGGGWSYRPGFGWGYWAIPAIATTALIAGSLGAASQPNTIVVQPSDDYVWVTTTDGLQYRVFRNSLLATSEYLWGIGTDGGRYRLARSSLVL